MSSSLTSSKVHSNGDEPTSENGPAGPEQQNQEHQLKMQQREYLYRALARQLEYYFSTNNLSRDTYVQTLRNLNDGCVPISILVGFGKVRTITASVTTIGSVKGDQTDMFEADDDDVDAINMDQLEKSDDITARAIRIVRIAATKYSDLLHVVRIDTKTGKRVESSSGNEKSHKLEGTEKNGEEISTEQDKGPATTSHQPPRTWRWAVGSISGEAILMDKLQSKVDAAGSMKTDFASNDNNITGIPMTTPNASKSVQSLSVPSTTSSSSSSSTSSQPLVANTIILRDVPKEDSNEATIKGLFNAIDDCPQIVSARLDVHDCWFVTLDTTSRDVMIGVMMKLRSATFPTSGIAVQARIKSVTTPSPGAYRPVRHDEIIPSMYAPQLAPASIATAKVSTNKSARSKRRTANRRGRTNRSENQHQRSSGSGSHEGGPQQRSANGKEMTGGIADTKADIQQQLTDGTRNEISSNHETVSPSTVTASIPEPQKLPSMGEDDFPTLPLSDTTAAKTVIRVEHTLALGKNEDDDLLLCNGDGETEEFDDETQSKVRCSGGFSDSASTATTSSTSSQSKQSSSCTVSIAHGGDSIRSKSVPSNHSRSGTPVVGQLASSSSITVGGYAAALLKKPPLVSTTSNPSTKKNATNGKASKQTSSTGKTKSSSKPSNLTADNFPSVSTSIVKPAWGGTTTGAQTSFADILRKD